MALSPHPVSIDGRPIGPADPPFLIAEAGVNHDGNPRLARRLIDAAKQAGADAVKFQIFSADRLVALGAPTCSYQKTHGSPAASQHELLRRLELSLGDFVELKAHADRIGIQFLATPFGLPELRWLIDHNVPAVKIASPDLVNVPLLTAAADSGKTLIVSTGAAELPEIDRAVALVRGRPAPPPLVLLHCVSAYPTDPALARLRCIAALASRFQTPVGFSDHTAEAGFGALAVAAGAVVLEKHLTLDRRAPGPDHFFSLEPHQFSHYAASAREAWRALGNEDFALSPAEREVRRLARGSIAAAVAISAGQRLNANLLSIRRPADGLDPSQWNELLGRKARTDIPAGTPLSTAMLE